MSYQLEQGILDIDCGSGLQHRTPEHQKWFKATSSRLFH
jgi:hypothetical protein